MTSTSTPTPSPSTGSGLLLRLFQSEFFTVHLAIAYLKTYHHSIGITYYLISRLDEFPPSEVEFYWPQLCHLLISRPSESLALESFIIHKSLISTHLALKTLWYLQASLSDLASNPTTPNFIVCRRAFNRIQSIIFSDPLLELSTQRLQHDPRIRPADLHLTPSANPTPTPSTSTTQLQSHPSSSGSSWKHTRNLTLNQFTRLKTRKISEKVLSTSVGIGLALAGLALPQLANQTGHLPIEQSKSYDQSVTINSSLKSKTIDDNNSASEEEEIDHLNNNHLIAHQQSPPLQRYRSYLSSSSLQQSKSQPSSRPKRITQSSLNYPSSSTSHHQPNHKSSRSFHHQPSPIKLSPSPAQVSLNQTTTLELSSSPSSSSTQIWSSPEPVSKPNLNQSEAQNIRTSLNPSILTAPISSTRHFLPASSANPNHDFRSNPQNSSHPPDSTSSVLPTVLPSYPDQHSTVSVGSHSSPRAHPNSGISQSAPSLPDALSKFKRNNTSTSSATHRNGRLSHRNDPINPIGSLASTLSIDPAQIPVGLLNQVLKSQSMRSQLELITNLQDIATRLVVVPKKARISALRAELTVLNHSLPKGCCLGMYCSGDNCDHDDGDNNNNEDRHQTDQNSCDDQNTSENHAGLGLGGPKTKRRKCHQRIVRISPNESVVLNSADRAPFLIHVEVLEDHLDFDPNRRSNHEDLRKAIKESAISSNNENEASKEPRNLYADRTLESRCDSSQFNPSKSASDHHRSIKSPAAQLASLSPPSALDESFNHLDLSSIDPSPIIHNSSCNSTHSSENNTHNHDQHHSQSILVEQSTSKFNEPNNHQPALLFSSPRQHHLNQHEHESRTSFDFPEISSNFPVPEEEVDIGDQTYGQDRKSSQSSDNESDALRYPFQSSGSLHLPPGWRNKTLDEETWKRAESIREGAHPNSSQPGLNQPEHIHPNPKSLTRSISHSGSSSQQIEPSSSKTLLRSPSNLNSTTLPPPRPTITLDEYAERMRMAAIMLAQLSASQQPSQSLTMTPSSAAGMVVGGAIGFGAGFVGVTVGAGLGAVVSRRLVGNGQTIITSPIGRKNSNPSSTSAQNVNGQGSSGISAKLDTSTADGRNHRAGGPKNDDGSSSSRIGPSTGPGSVPKQKLLTPQQSQAIKDKIMAEMMLLEEERMQRMRLDRIDSHTHELRSAEDPKKEHPAVVSLADEVVVMKAVNEDDPSGKMLSESWEDKRNRIRSSSPYGHLANWNLFSLIVKTGTDLRQEQIVIQLIHEFGRIWEEENCNVWVKYYGILVTGESTGLMETIVDAVSIHSLKKSAYSKLSLIQQASRKNQPNSGGASGLPNYSLFDHYVDTYGPPTGRKYKKAQENFMRSLVSYSIISYILQLKDRHNGNILIDKDGHIIHIDFGFVLNNSPGSIGFEMAPFKLSQEYLEVLDPPSSFISVLDGKRHAFDPHLLPPNNDRLNQFNNFVTLFKLSFKKIRKHAERIITIAELMQVESKLPCFGGKNNLGENVIKNLRDRFQLHLNSDDRLDEFLDKLVLSSINSVFTKLYDSFQYFSQGVL